MERGVHALVRRLRPCSRGAASEAGEWVYTASESGQHLVEMHAETEVCVLVRMDAFAEDVTCTTLAVERA